jgi:hypothetical protein
MLKQVAHVVDNCEHQILQLYMTDRRKAHEESRFRDGCDEVVLQYPEEHEVAQVWKFHFAKLTQDFGRKTCSNPVNERGKMWGGFDNGTKPPAGSAVVPFYAVAKLDLVK